MPTDLFEKLADVPVPPPPPSKQFDRAVHAKINDRLIVGQIFDFWIRGAGFGAAHFSKALVGLLRLTFTGKFDKPKPEYPPKK